MGNTVFASCWETVITVQLRDGSLKLYNPPVTVRDILTEHPSFLVVSMSKGKAHILSSDLDLLPGRKYYILSPDSLLSTGGNSRMHKSEHSIHGKYTHLPKIAAFHCTSAATSLLGVFIPSQCCMPQTRKPKFLGVTQKHNKLAPISDDRKNGKLPSTSLAPAAATSGAVSSPRRLTLQDQVIAEAPKPRSENAKCCCHLLTLFWKAARVRWNSLRAKSRDMRCRFDSVRKSTLAPEREGSFGVQRKSFKRQEDKSGAFGSQPFPKERWLEDMIRGADNQWKRVKLMHAFIIEGCENECQDFGSTKVWGLCMPLGRQSPSKSSAKGDDCQETISAIWQGQSPSQLEDYLLDGEKKQLIWHLKDSAGAFSAKKVGIEGLEKYNLGIEHKVQQGSLAASMDNKTVHTLRHVMDDEDLEHLSLLRPEAPPLTSTTRNFLQRFARSDSATRARSPNVDFVER